MAPVQRPQSFPAWHRRLGRIPVPGSRSLVLPGQPSPRARPTARPGRKRPGVSLAAPASTLETARPPGQLPHPSALRGAPRRSQAKGRPILLQTGARGAILLAARPANASTQEGVPVATGNISCLTCHHYAARTRGCCERCYYRHRQAVNAGQTTWPDLESRRLVAPARPRGHAWRGWKMGQQLSTKPSARPVDAGRSAGKPGPLPGGPATR
jgi:hypothetical protein